MSFSLMKQTEGNGFKEFYLNKITKKFEASHGIAEMSNCITTPALRSEFLCK